MLTNQEGRNQQNNIRIFGLKWGAEGSSITQFIEQLLKMSCLCRQTWIYKYSGHIELWCPNQTLVNPWDLLWWTPFNTRWKRRGWGKPERKNIHYQNEHSFLTMTTPPKLSGKEKNTMLLKKPWRRKEYASFCEPCRDFRNLKGDNGQRGMWVHGRTD